MITIMIPVRYASKRLPGKPLIKIKGSPVIQHVWERCVLAAQQLDTARAGKGALPTEVVILADHDDVIKTCKAFGATVYDTRHFEVENGTERCAYMADALELINSDKVINVQGDNWNIAPEAIIEIVNNMVPTLPHERMRTLFALREQRAPDHPDYLDHGKVKVTVDNKDNAVWFKRDEHHPHHFDIHCGIYGYFRTFLTQYMMWKTEYCSLERMEDLEQMRVIENGGKIHCPLLQYCDTAGESINTPADVEKANQ